jgi:hypothetical protein
MSLLIFFLILLSVILFESIFLSYSYANEEELKDPTTHYDLALKHIFSFLPSFKGETLYEMGLLPKDHPKANRKIIDIRKTNFQTKISEIFADMIYLLDDHSHLLLEFESSFRYKENLKKYIKYILGFKDYYISYHKKVHYQDIDLLFIVIYTGKIRSSIRTTLSDKNFVLISHLNFLNDINKKDRFAELEEKLAPKDPSLQKNKIIFLDIFHLVVLGLVGRTFDKKTLFRCVDLVKNSQIKGLDDNAKMEYYINVDILYSSLLPPDELEQLFENTLLQKYQQTALQRVNRQTFLRGKAEGKAEAEVEGKAEIAKRMIRAGFTNSQILEISLLNLLAIDTLRKKLRIPEPADKA